MATSKNGDRAKVAVTSADEVRHLVGLVTDHTVAEILDTQPSEKDLEVAVIFVRGEGDAVDRLGHELAGKAARIYDILAKDELYQNNDR